MLKNGGVSFVCCQGHVLIYDFNYRLVADVLNDLAMFLDLLAPIFPHLFMLIICLSSVTRVGVVY